MSHPTKTVYDLIGADGFERLAAGFYRRVADDPILRPLYPEPDLAGAEHRLRLFLMQYFGGPADYSAERGHPRLRMRHMPYRIGATERDAWVAAMLGALDEAAISDPAYTVMRDYFEGAATFLMNAAPFGDTLSHA